MGAGALSKLILYCRNSKDREVQDQETGGAITIFTMIPDLALYEIFTKLDWRNLKNCRLVCDRWEKLLRETIFVPENNCYEYKLLEPSILRALQTLWKPIWTKKMKLEFLTMRLSSPLNISVFPGILTLMRNLWALKSELRFVTRLELELNIGRIDQTCCSENICYLVGVIYKFDNITELIVTEVAGLGRIFGSGRTDPDLSRLPCGDGQIKLKKLKTFVYNMIEPCNLFKYLLPAISVCDNLVNFEMRIKYKESLANPPDRVKLYTMIGNILRSNASALKNFCIGTTKYSDEFMGFWNVHQLFSLEINTLGQWEEMWMEEENTSMFNDKFETLFNLIESENWKDFGLNNLEHLTIEFPETILPTPINESIRKPFVDSLISLKTLTIQPIVALKTENGTFVTRMPRTVPRLANIIDKQESSKLGESYSCPQLMSDIVYISDTINVELPTLWKNCQRSALHLVFKTSKETNRIRNICYKNVPWRNTSFSSSQIVPHLRLLTKLVIYQNNHCPPQTSLLIKDADLQLIIREGRSIQTLILKCDLSAVTPFGYTGIPVATVNDLNSIPITDIEARRESKCGLSILDLEGLAFLVLSRLNGQYTIESPSTPDMRINDFETLKNYFLETNRLKHFLLGYERLTACFKTYQDGSQKEYSNTCYNIL